MRRVSEEAKDVDYREVLRRLTIGDASILDTGSSGNPGALSDYTLDAKASSFACLGASVALGASSSGYQEYVNAALAAGATVDEVVGVLIAVAPAVGLTSVISAAPALGLAVGYDPEAALEALKPQDE